MWLQLEIMLVNYCSLVLWLKITSSTFINKFQITSKAVCRFWFFFIIFALLLNKHFAQHRCEISELILKI